MAQWWSRVEKAVDFAVALATRRPNGGGQESGATEGPRGLVGSFEARMTGVLVSALREAFNRDAARLEAEREQAESERRRAELALQLEVARQAAERGAARLRAVGALTGLVWLASLVFVIIHPPEAGAARSVLAAAWTCLTVAVAAVLLGYGRLGDVAERIPPALGGTSPQRRFSAADIASWAAVTGLALAAASLLISM